MQLNLYFIPDLGLSEHIDRIFNKISGCFIHRKFLEKGILFINSQFINSI